MELCTAEILAGVLHYIKITKTTKKRDNTGSVVLALSLFYIARNHFISSKVGISIFRNTEIISKKNM